MYWVGRMVGPRILCGGLFLLKNRKSAYTTTTLFPLSYLFVLHNQTMLQTRIVPWINYEEFETVYHWLFADRKTQSDTIQLGIDRVSKIRRLKVKI